MVLTPLMKQYYEIKEKYSDAIVLFQVGDFYESFGKDAQMCSKTLGIILTKRANGSASEVALAGFPCHALNMYLPKLVKAGFRVAICNQLEDPKKTKTLVKRGVIELVTPGMVMNQEVLESHSNNFIASICFDKDQIGIALLDISTGEFLVAQDKAREIHSLIKSFNPKEILYQKQKSKEVESFLRKEIYSNSLEDWAFDYGSSYEKLNAYFQTHSLKGFGIEDLKEGIRAAGSILSYLSYTQHHQLDHIKRIKRIEKEKYLWIDNFTFKNLEILNSMQQGGSSLVDILDKTGSAMGSRLLKRWLMLPLKEISSIEKRYEGVEAFLNHKEIHSEIIGFIKKITDIERLISRMVIFRITPLEIILLLKSLGYIGEIKKIFSLSDSKVFNAFSTQIDDFKPLEDRIKATLNENETSNKEDIIKRGFSSSLDELKDLVSQSKNHLEKICLREKENTGISSLKIDFNQVFGYYIEVRNVHHKKVPDNWRRKQTLSNAERFITPELKEYEIKILEAQEKINHLEKELFEDLLRFIATYIEKLQKTANLIAQVDVLCSFALIAYQNNYSKPILNDSLDLYIKEGRHPIIEKTLAIGETYIPNDISLDKHTQILVITGPNMSGKSALLRQSILIVFMAQIGSYVPASEVVMGIVDKIFSRVGAWDNISQGESTFMVEMNETASILNNLSDRSFLILDEIGRGTSTYDGVSIAWAVAEYIHQNKCRAKTLFATHYHELSEMALKFERIKNFYVSVKQNKENIIFIRKLLPGSSHHSFGLHVAKLAGLPNELVLRASEILMQLENRGDKKMIKKTFSAPIPLNLFEEDDSKTKELFKVISALDLDKITPIEALLELEKIKEKIKDLI